MRDWTPIIVARKRRGRRIGQASAILGLGVLVLGPLPAATAQTAVPQEPFAPALLAAYPAIIARIAGNSLELADGRTLAIDDGLGIKSPEALLANPDIKDMFAANYPLAFGGTPTDDPGRARNAAFFNAVYGDCRKGEVDRQLVDVVWLPSKSKQVLRVTRRNGVADRLAEVSRALDALPDSLTRYLVPAAGGYHCRAIAGTTRMSAHGYGIAVDIAIKHADYWRWPSRKSDATIIYRNAIPETIVAIFEQHGFIWGGKWRHHDTMHFEYRPELIAAAKAARP